MVRAHLGHSPLAMTISPRSFVAPLGIADAIAWASWTRDAEASASSDASASSYRCSEDIGILAIVVAKLKLIQIQGQIFLAHVVIGADHATLEQRPERFEIVGMDFAAHVFVRFVVNVLVRECLMQLLIASRFIRGDQTNLVRYWRL
jgi:hypothetical protein